MITPFRGLATEKIFSFIRIKQKFLGYPFHSYPTRSLNQDKISILYQRHHKGCRHIALFKPKHLFFRPSRFNQSPAQSTHVLPYQNNTFSS